MGNKVLLSIYGTESAQNHGIRKTVEGEWAYSEIHWKGMTAVILWLFLPIFCWLSYSLLRTAFAVMT